MILPIKAIIFDLDGVIVSTDEYHYLAWKKMASEEGIPFDRKINEKLRGISRMQSLEIILKNASRNYSYGEKSALADRKNKYYKELIQSITSKNILPGALNFINEAKSVELCTAVASSSKNAIAILQRIGLENFFDTVVSGRDIRKSKPDPEVFLTAAKRLGIIPEKCLVVEDSYAGIEAAKSGNMKTLAVGYASGSSQADLRTKDLASLPLNEMIKKLSVL
jgi:beta-phosphoglucomutase